jgi:hypothetical protein
MLSLIRLERFGIAAREPGAGIDHVEGIANRDGGKSSWFGVSDRSDFWWKNAEIRQGIRRGSKELENLSQAVEIRSGRSSVSQTDNTHGAHAMQTKLSRQPWGFNPNWTRVEALDDQNQPLGYVYFIPRWQPAAHRPPKADPGALPERTLWALFSMVRQLVWCGLSA